MAQAYRFSRKLRNYAMGSLSGDPRVVAAFAWFRTEIPSTEQYFMSLGGGRAGIRALGLRDGRVTAATGVHGDLRYAAADKVRIEAGDWYWACASWVDSTVELFVSGKLRSSDFAPFLPSDVKILWHVGCMGGFTGERYFSGELARWGWVPRVLSDVEVADLAAGVDCPEDVQPGVLSLDERSPLPVHDEAPVPPIAACLPATGARTQPRRMG